MFKWDFSKDIRIFFNNHNCIKWIMIGVKALKTRKPFSWTALACLTINVWWIWGVHIKELWAGPFSREGCLTWWGSPHGDGWWSHGTTFVNRETNRETWPEALPSRNLRLLSYTWWWWYKTKHSMWCSQSPLKPSTVQQNHITSIITTLWDIITTMVWQERAKFALGDTMECFEYIGGLVMNGVPSVQLATFLAKISNKRAELPPSLLYQ